MMSLSKKTSKELKVDKTRCLHMSSLVYLHKLVQRLPSLNDARAYIGVHVCGSVEENTGVVSPLKVVHFSTIEQVVKTIIIVVVWRNGSNSPAPIPRLHRPFGICRIISVTSQASGDIEEAALGDCVLVIVAIVERENLPFEAPIATRGIPSIGLQVEDCLGESEPLRLVCKNE